jgi:membrane protein DedA with SNARE-associated domain
VQDWVIRLIDWGGYPGVFLLCLIETIVPPIPSEVILPLAGMRAANGPLGLPGVVIAATAGSMAGNTIWYFAARAIGLDRLRTFLARHGRWLGIDWRDIERVRGLFDRFGGGIVFTGRMVPAIRTFVSIPAGVVRMPRPRFLIWSTLGTSLFAAAFAAAGYWAGAQIHRIDEFAGPASLAVIGAILLWYVWRQLTWNRRGALEPPQG